MGSFHRCERGAVSLRFGLVASFIAVFAYSWFSTAGYWLQGTIGSVTTTVLTAAHRIAGS